MGPFMDSPTKVDRLACTILSKSRLRVTCRVAEAKSLGIKSGELIS